MLTPSTLLRNRYRIIKLHEMGHDNPVYLAHDERQGFDVAIKENTFHDPDHQQQFRLEGVLLANIIHPNIPRGIDFLDDDGRQFMVMDFIEGINLQQLIQQRKPGVDEIIGWSATLCDTLAYLHSRKPAIIHRDVEPSNIILATNGCVYLVDFGFAKVYRAESEAILKKRGTSRTDTRSDQYSLAATMYYLLSGAPPVDGLKRAMDNETLQPIQPPRPDLPTAVEKAIYRAMSIDPADRFGNIERFKSAIMSEKKGEKKSILKFWR